MRERCKCCDSPWMTPSAMRRHEETEGHNNRERLFLSMRNEGDFINNAPFDWEHFYKLCSQPETWKEVV